MTKKSLALAFAVCNAAPALAADWSGTYVGISGGGGIGQQGQQGGVLQLPSSGGGGVQTTGSISTITLPTSTSMSTTTNTSGPPADGGYKTHGGLVGGAVGYNFQQGPIVYGAALDGSWSNISGSGTCSVGTIVAHACGGGIRALGTVRGHLGYDIAASAFGPFSGLQVFAAGGLAIANVRAYDSLFNTSGSGTQVGWTLGGGVEAMFGSHWSVTLEYMHADLGRYALFTAAPPLPERVRTTADVFRVGLGYHFNSTALFSGARY